MSIDKRLRIHPEIRKRATQLRHPLTSAEKRLWSVIRNRQSGGFKIRRQVPVGPYIVDFYCAEAQLVIEIDGDKHADQINYDNYRTAWLEAQGYTVIRFQNTDILHRLSEVTSEILRTCQEKKNPKPD